MSETQRQVLAPPEATLLIAGTRLTAQELAPLFLTMDDSPPVTYSGLGSALKKLCGSEKPLGLNVEQWRSIVRFLADSPQYLDSLGQSRSRHPFPILNGLQGLLGMLSDRSAPQDASIELNPLPVPGHSYLCDLSEDYFTAAMDQRGVLVVNDRFLAKTSPRGGEFGDTVLLALEACSDPHGHETVPGFLYTPIGDQDIQLIKGARTAGSTTVQIPNLDLAFARPLDRSESFDDDPRDLLVRAQKFRTEIWSQGVRQGANSVLKDV